jgi:hypothetical protein
MVAGGQQEMGVTDDQGQGQEVEGRRGQRQGDQREEPALGLLARLEGEPQQATQEGRRRGLLGTPSPRSAINFM